MFGDRPRVTLTEWKEHVRPVLNSEGFSDHKLDRLEALFEQSFQKNPAIPDWKPGIDQPTLDQTMKYLREHKDDLMFDDRELGLVQSILERYITTRS